ncbi:MAG: hypothetical protein Q8930_20205, partial [Bacillota bacterium]|nr:hypothetical protein [Bacillota bacterium]
TAADSDVNTNLPERLWKKNNEPLRQIVLWGWDENNNPGFLILYGTQHFKSKGATGNLLQNEVKYTDYVIFMGKGSHLPSLQAVEVIRPYDYRSRTHGAPRMYYKRGAANRWYGDNNNQYLVKEFKNIPPEQQVSFPYYIPLSQEQYVGKMVNRPQNFRLANNPNDILKLSGQLLDYYPTIVDMMSNQNIYMRKKRLKELIDKSCGKQVLKMLLEVGGTDIVSGLFLELAKQGNPILLGEAKAMLEGEMKWAEENYAEGIKRCIRIYINAVNPDLKADRKEWIYRYLSKMDLHLVRINEKDIPPDKVLEGADYRRYANSGQLQDYYWRYDYKTRTNSKYEASRRYEAGLYNDGVRLRLIDFKNTIQEAEVYGLADVVGRIGYYLDAPRITYYLKGSGKEKALRYFRRYIKRIINSYAEADPDKFIVAMKEFLTSYSKPDYTGKFSGNFQSNELLKYYIYHEYKEKPASGWQSYNWIDDDQLLKLKGRYEYRKDIWDNHLDAAAEIAVRAKIETVAKACYYILKDSPKSGEFIENAGYRQLINLSLVAYGPMSEMFMGILDNRIKKLDSFDSELMICLIGSGDERMYMTAMEFFHRTNGLFSPSDTADLLFLDNLSRWEELFRENLLSLEGEQYINFIIETIKKSSEGLKYKGELPEGITEILSKTTEKVGRLSDSDRAALIKELIAALLHGTRLPLWLQIFIEEVIFSTSHEALEALAKDIYIETVGVTVSARSRRVISMLDAIKARDIPADAQLIDILRSGTPKMINVLFGIITENSEKLM